VGLTRDGVPDDKDGILPRIGRHHPALVLAHGAARDGVAVALPPDAHALSAWPRHAGRVAPSVHSTHLEELLRPGAIVVDDARVRRHVEQGVSLLRAQGVDTCRWCHTLYSLFTGQGKGHSQPNVPPITFSLKLNTQSNA
jgi:hypothetical protein